MPSSKRRKIFRLQLGVNRKSTATRWMGEWTVGVLTKRYWKTFRAQLKAGKGAERSCQDGVVQVHRARRSSRGQRRGKRRARGCHPREPPPSARRSKEPSVRKIDRHLRAVDWAWERVGKFEKLMRQSKFVRHWVGSWSYPMQPERYSIWKLRWSKLRKQILAKGEIVASSSGIGPTFSYFLEQRLRLNLHPRDLTNPVSARSVLLDMASALEIRTNFTSIRNRPDTRPHLYTITCDWCRTSWGASLRAARCPDCTRLCSSRVKRGGRRSRGSFRGSALSRGSN